MMFQFRNILEAHITCKVNARFRVSSVTPKPDHRLREFRVRGWRRYSRNRSMTDDFWAAELIFYYYSTFIHVV